MRQRSFGGGKRPPRFRKRRNFSKKEKSIDVNKLVNKASVSEKAEVYISEHTFEDFKIDSRLKRNTAEKGYKTPTPIQDKAIPPALEGKDLVGTANTGTGKTAAFLLPMLHKVLNNPKEKVLILAPTRELALQIEEEFRVFARGLGINSVLCIGGTNMKAQIRSLQRKYHFIIGTPGRIKDLNQRNLIHLRTFGNVILDEVDRMLDMGFIHDIKKLLGELPRKRHSLFFSATISRDIDDLIKGFLYNPLKISVKVRETAANVDQDVIKIKSNE